MTIHTSLLLSLAAVLAAPGLAPARSAPRAPASDAVRVRYATFGAHRAYARLRSYSGRFQLRNGSHPTNLADVLSGEIRWALPNRLWMRARIKSNGKAYSRHAVCDGRFLWISDSSLGGNFTKRPIGTTSGAEGIAAMIHQVNAYWSMDMASLMSSSDPLQNPAAVRITSASRSSAAELRLALEARYRVASEDDAAGTKTTSSPIKTTFRFGADRLLREMTSRHSAPDNGYRAEKHWNIRRNPALPASLFRFKPAPGARQVERLEPPGPTQARLSQP